MFKNLSYDINNILERDPAARSKIEVLLLYPCIHALIAYRIAHFLYNHKRFFCARLLSQLARFFTGIEIHPGAKIGKGLFIDHEQATVVGCAGRNIIRNLNDIIEVVDEDGNKKTIYNNMVI